MNSSQAKVLKEKYIPIIDKYKLNPVTVPMRPTAFCDEKRSAEITDEVLRQMSHFRFVLTGME